MLVIKETTYRTGHVTLNPVKLNYIHIGKRWWARWNNYIREVK